MGCWRWGAGDGAPPLGGASGPLPTAPCVVDEWTVDYLLKTEPSEYSFVDLQRDDTTRWDGVANPTAVKHLREMQPGDRLIIYETGTRRCAVGTASVSAVDASDPRNPRVDIVAGAALSPPVSLDTLKAHELFADSPLVRQGRLSVVPLTEAQYRFLAGGAVEGRTTRPGLRGSTETPSRPAWR